MQEHFTGTLSEATSLAWQHHQAGKLFHAQNLYKQILQIDPGNAQVSLLLGAVFFQLGQLGDAVASYEQVLRAQPRWAEAHHGLGLAFNGQGRNDDAIACYLRCLEINPDHSEACNNLGNALVRASQSLKAISYYQKALRINPNYAEAHNNLAIAFKDQQNLRDAITHFRRAIELKPGYVAALIGLGGALAEQGQWQEAINHYREADRFQPENAESHAKLADAFLELGQPKEAMRHCHAALRIKSDFAPALFNLAQLAVNGHYHFTDAQLETLESMVQNRSFDLEDEINIRFAMGALLDNRRQYDQAFEQYQRANQLKKALSGQQGTMFDRRGFREKIDELIKTFVPGFVENMRGCGVDSQLPVFIVGMPRSGTTLVEQILSNHPQIHGAGELKDIELIAAEISKLGINGESYISGLANLGLDGIRSISKSYLLRLHELGGEALRVTDKMPGNFLQLGLIALLFPGARVIHCLRDPRDVCLSCYFQKFNRTPFASDLEDIGSYYLEYQRLMTHWEKVLPLRMTEVVYENLIMNQEAESRRLIAFCELEWAESCLTFHGNRRPVQTASKLQVRRPIYRSSIERWKYYAKHLVPFVKILDSAHGKEKP